MTGGYIQSAWVYKSFPNCSLHDLDGAKFRTRVTIKEASDFSAQNYQNAEDTALL